MKVLVACEFSEVVKYSFLTKGHDAHSCDYLPGEQGLINHHQCDVRELLGHYWDMIIAHPPCPYLTNTAVSWLHRRPERWVELDKAAAFFRLFLDNPCEKICVENPIPHKYAVERIGRKYDQLIQPYMFGHTERKATCFWLKGLPKLEETHNVKNDMLKLSKPEQQRIHYMAPSPERGKNRSRTFQGIADAMAEQWG